MYVPDVYDQWEARERALEAELKMLPVCSHCQEHIQADQYYDIDGVILCPDCLADHYTKWTEDYIE